MSVVVRAARAEDVWPLRSAVLRPGLPIERAHFDGDAGAAHFVAELDGVIVGVASVFDAAFETWHAQLRGMATDPAHRGRRAGLALLRTVEERYGAALWCNARTSAQGFYARAGWVVRSEVFEIDGVGPHVKMTAR